MDVIIRPATIDDATAIAKIIHMAFDEEVDQDRVINQIMISNTIIDVAVCEGQVVGFVENFVTRSIDNQLRLELDLLAVHPDFHGQGVGRKLIVWSVEFARALTVHQIRALIATTNSSMRHLCADIGMAKDEYESGLFTWSCDEKAFNIIADITSHLIRVNTLTYDGIWLEGMLSQSAIENAQNMTIRQTLDVVGVVYPIQSKAGVQLLHDNSFVHIKNFHRWTLNLQNDSS